MNVANIRTLVQQRIYEEYLILKEIIEESDKRLGVCLQNLLDAENEEIALVYESDFEIRSNIIRGINTRYQGATEYYENIVFASRRIFLASIFSYYEGCLRYIIRTSNIRVDKKKPNTKDLLEAIKKGKGDISSTAKKYEERVCSELRVLRNFYIHPRLKKMKSSYHIVKSKEHLEISDDGQLLITKCSVLMEYLGIVKTFLEILDEHCSTKTHVL